MRNTEMVMSLLLEGFSNKPLEREAAKKLFTALSEMSEDSDLVEDIVLAILYSEAKNGPIIEALPLKLYTLPGDKITKLLQAVAFAHPDECERMLLQFQLGMCEHSVRYSHRFLGNDKVVLNALLELPSLELGWDAVAQLSYTKHLVKFLGAVVESQCFRERTMEKNDLTSLSSAVSKFFQGMKLPLGGCLPFLEPALLRVGDAPSVHFPPTTFPPSLDEALLRELMFKVFNRFLLETQIRLVVPYIKTRELVVS